MATIVRCMCGEFYERTVTSGVAVEKNSAECGACGAALACWNAGRTLVFRPIAVTLDSDRRARGRPLNVSGLR